MTPFRSIVALVLACSLAACSESTPVGGPAATGSVVGRCVDAGGAPVAGVAVHWQKSTEVAQSDADGRFRKEFSFDAHFPSMQSVLVLEKEGFAPLSVDLELEDGDALDLGDLPLE
ncbi:MAG: carboxypeptidase regulatory-like domain-containing protein [Planctomycetes bacterium]|nr:carboxypeptidase regulatory-like domain-containing protein [Planctomycetota bacterium]